MHKYVKTKEAAELLGLNRQTLIRYAKKGKIIHKQLPSGHYVFDVEAFLAGKTKPEKENVCYCRVSTHGQKDDLTRQIEYMKEKYPEFRIITDVGSGINFKRPGLTEIIDLAVENKLAKVVVAYKDRLCRIGYELIEHILVKYSGAEIIIDSKTNETINEEMANDILQIVTVYSAKINGMRKYKKAKFDSI